MTITPSNGSVQAALSHRWLLVKQLPPLEQAGIESGFRGCVLISRRKRNKNVTQWRRLLLDRNKYIEIQIPRGKSFRGLEQFFNRHSSWMVPPWDKQSILLSESLLDTTFMESWPSENYLIESVRPYTQKTLLHV